MERKTEANRQTDTDRKATSRGTENIKWKGEKREKREIKKKRKLERKTEANKSK